jgi:uncharacterized repeat protein (TIGR01451 family)
MEETPMKNRAWRLLVAGLLLASFVTPMNAAASVVSADVGRPSVQQAPESNLAAAGQLRSSIGAKASAQRNQPAPRVIGETDPNGSQPSIYIVQLQSQPLASYRGGVNDLPATSPAVTGASLDATGAAERAYLAHLSTEQQSALDSIQRALGRSVEVKFTYQVAFNGFALVLTPVEAAKVAGLTGIRLVQRDFVDQPQTDFGPAWIGAPAVWGGAPGAQGEGVVVGVIDTGVNFVNPAFARIGADGYVHTNPRGKHYGVCDPANTSIYDPTFTCNEKLIGAWDFADSFEPPDGPRDNDGHGSHTASTVAGNRVNASVIAPTYVYNNLVSGVAPRANIIAYDACGLEGCPGSALVAAINQAVADSVDVINYSIGGGSRNPWRSADALAFLAALDAGVYVSVSAGNAGPPASTIGSPSNAPWVTSVAAATHHRKFANRLIDMSGGNAAPPADISGQGLTGGYGPARIVYAGNYTSTFGASDALCRQPFPPGTFNGEIVVCDRGVVGRVAKNQNVAAGGAGGFVLANDALNGESLNADAYALPGVHITYDDGVALKVWLAAGGVTSATIAGAQPQVNPAFGDIMAAFSSRGPDATLPSVLKPDITAPGVDIMAAIHTGGNYGVLSGASMAAPHNAGAATLLRQLHPNWTPAEVRSALMLTSRTTVLEEDGVTPADPFAMGAGRVDVELAAEAGFVLDESAIAFYMADPALGGNPRMLNLASLADPQCVGVCTWTRTLKSVSAATEEYTVNVNAPAGVVLTVQPNAFTLPAGGTQVITVTADVTAAALDEWLFGQVNVDAVNPNVADGHLPVAVYTRAGGAAAGLSELVIDTRRNRGRTTLEGVRAITTTTLVKALYLGATQAITGYVAQDPTNNDPYDIENGGVYTTLIPVTDPQTARLAFEIVESTAPDLDLFVGIDFNGNGRPDPNEELCRSTSASWDEFCVIENPIVGDYWAIVQNWQGSGADADFFAMEVTQVSRNNQSAAFTVSGPGSAEIGTPFDLQLAWNFPTLTSGDTRLALLEVGTDAGAPNNILSLPVTLRRLDDDVTAWIDDPQVLVNDYAQPGDVISYTVRIAPEPTAPSPVNYVVTATLPAGLTYMPGSAVLASSTMQATIDPIVNGNQLIWNVADVVNTSRYVMSTNDPERDDYSPACRTPFGNQFLHLSDFDIPLRPTVDGNGKTWNVDAFFGGSEPYTFFGDNYSLLSFTDDGLLSVLGFDPALNSGVNALIPTPAAPNALLAPGWADFKIVYDEDEGTGVRIAGAGGGVLMFIEYNGLQNNEGAEGALDMQAAVWRVVTPDYPEIVFSYDRIAGALPNMVIGVESVDGAEGVAYTDGIRDNLLICFDWTADEVDLTYSVQVNQDAALNQEQETTYQSTLSAPGYGLAETIDALFVTGVVLEMSVSGLDRVLPGSPITYTLTVTNSGVGEAANLQVMAEMPWGARHLHGGSVNGRIVSFEISSLAGGASTQLQYSVEHDDAQLVAAASPTRQLSPTIVGGGPAAPGEFPWQAALLDASNGLWWGCGGSLISPTWVATAAHCVTSGPFASPSQALNVAVGRHTVDSNEGQRIAVAEIIVHPGWNPWTYDADIALLRLAQPAILTDTVQTIPLATAADAALMAEGRLAIATGWGTRTEGQQDFPDVLYKVTVPFVAQTACEFAYATTGNTITDNMVCAGLLQGGKDACQGDSGGPLVVSDDIDSYKLAGIVSWGEGCARPGLPGVYTRVANFVDWIGLQRDTLKTGRYMVSDASGLPGHSFVGDDPITTIVRAIQLMLPVISR